MSSLDDERPAEDLGPGVDVVGTTTQTVMRATVRKQRIAAVPPSEPIRHYKWRTELRRCPDVTGTQLLVLLTLATWMSSDDEAWPAQSTIAAATGLSEKTVQKLLTVSCRQGWIRKRWGGGMKADGSRASVTYLPRAPRCTAGCTPPHSGAVKGDTPLQTTANPALDAEAPRPTAGQRGYEHGDEGVSSAPAAPGGARSTCRHGKPSARDPDGFLICPECEALERASA